MVDVSNKTKSKRTAHARAELKLPDAAQLSLEHHVNKKGSPLHTAVIGGIMAAKQTWQLIPLCHQIPLDKVDVDVQQSSEDKSVVLVDCKVSAFHHTGVEMEALVGASIASCVVYDMLKAASHGIVIQSVRLIEKTGGKKDFSAPE